MAKINEWMSEWLSERASKRPTERTNKRTNEQMLFVWHCEHLSDMWLSTLEIGSTQLRFVTEIAPKSPFSCENRSPIRYGRTDQRTTNNERMLFVWQCEHLSDMWLFTLELGTAQLRSITEIAPKSPFLCENRSPTRYGRTDERTNERKNEFFSCGSVNTYPICDCPL